MGEIDDLIEKFNAGKMTSKDELQLEKHIASGQIEMSQLKTLEDMRLKLEALPMPEPSIHMDDRFNSLLSKEKRKVKTTAPSTLIVWWASIKQSQWQWAYSATLVVFGIGIGLFFDRSSQNKMDILTSEMHEMKEMMMLSMLEKESTTDRLRAVSLTIEIGTSEKVAMALINTLRTDDNNNVRMAAIEALSHYTGQPTVRKALITSIQYQKSPLVQLALAELMVAMNEKSAKKAFDQLWKSENTPDEIKMTITEKMQTMI